jgi:hypothetical protein
MVRKTSRLMMLQTVCVWKAPTELLGIHLVRLTVNDTSSTCLLHLFRSRPCADPGASFSIQTLTTKRSVCECLVVFVGLDKKEVGAKERATVIDQKGRPPDGYEVLDLIFHRSFSC